MLTMVTVQMASLDINFFLLYKPEKNCCLGGTEDVNPLHFDAELQSNFNLFFNSKTRQKFLQLSFPFHGRNYKV